MARDWRGWVALGLLAVAGSAQACFVAPRVEQVAPGILRMPPRSAQASWAVLPVHGKLPESRLRSGGNEPDCSVDFIESPDHPALVSVNTTTPHAVRLSLASGDHVYGLGDKSGPMDRRGRVFTFWNTDAYAWDAARDPLYKSIPFLIVERAGRVFGVFADATQRMTVDVGKTDPNAILLTVADGPLDLYVIDGPTPRALLQRYTALTGRTPLPPKWALGFQQSRYTYLPEARVREVAKTLRDKRIPADAIWLDIGFQDANKPFTVDRKAFPDFEGMLGDLRKDGFHTVLITDLHIAKQAGYAPYESGKAIDAFVKREGADYVGKVWPGDSVFPDFSRAQVRDWWGGLYTDFVRMGAAGFWNDMNEPSVFDVPGGTMPDDVVHRYDDGSTRTHAQLHNVYGMLNARATYEGLLQLTPDGRPFVLTRAAYAGTQRYAATWTGDNTADWHHLAQGVPNILSLGLSGMALAGDDIGGFIGSPPPELLTRWYQLGAWQPIFRSHAATDTRDHEAWVDGPVHEALRRSAIEQRYRLMPYLYTLAEENARTGAPITRPVWFEFPKAGGSDRDFLFGRDLFVAPVVSERLDAHVVQLPPGAWYGLRDGKRYSDKVTFDPAPSEVPVFVRAGAIVPMQAVVQHTGQVPKGPLEVHVWWPEGDAPCDGALYDDDGTSMAYQRGEFVRIAFACRVEGDALVVEAKREQAGFAPWWRAAEVIVHRADGTTRTHHIANARADWTATLR
ncbi:Alpha-glucosidase [Lysobacter dokdonensis DS-58]|uniref:Alpha-glucosidase n=1 Tax=Lysobacter dokdonensis DS-58 TaxID=1300345 RepID=A0A0A2WLN6_9GAMM|nr:TIM-barrel domain-containing protein [Lysobacter dokdonensis]KGQ20698.1 Alpha-glucosidase [Lysobacter dokdonensis DS-58]